MSLKSISEGRKDMFDVRLECLIEDDNNQREDYGDLEGLAMSISKEGQRKPMEIRMDGKEQAIITDGHRRFRAIKIANEKFGAQITSARCIHEDKGTNEETRIINRLVSNDGKQFGALEEARAYKLLINYNWSEKQIADHIGKPVVYVKERLELNSAPHEIRTAVRKKRIAPTAATRLSKASPDKQKKVLASPNKKIGQKDVEKVTRGKQYNLSVKEIEKKRGDVETLWKNSDLKGKRFWSLVLNGVDVALGNLTIQEVLDMLKNS